LSVIYYKRRRGNIECESISRGGDNKIELRFEDNITGTVKLGKLLKKIDGKSCIFDTGAMEDGIYRPEIRIADKIIEPEAFEISGGEARLIPKTDAYVRELSGKVELLFRELSKLDEKLRVHDEKINGNPIF
jgi:hypothetical protein